MRRDEEEKRSTNQLELWYQITAVTRLDKVWTDRVELVGRTLYLGTAKSKALVSVKGHWKMSCTFSQNKHQLLPHV